jgi:hypothetical protein
MTGAKKTHVVELFLNGWPIHHIADQVSASAEVVESVIREGCLRLRAVADDALRAATPNALAPPAHTEKGPNGDS